MNASQPKRSIVQVKKRDHKILRRDKKNLEKRLERKHFDDQPEPMFKDSNIVYEIGDRTRVIGYGGIGAIHKMVCKLKLDVGINDRIELLKIHVPYHESDHVLNIAYNVLSGGTCFEDIDRLRNDETYMNALGATRIPDPTTAGDFVRRFVSVSSVVELQETFNTQRKKLWMLQNQSFRKEAIIDVDGTIAGTLGECKEGMDISYKGIWGYAPLIVTLANTNEELYLVNRPGNRPSSDQAAEWIDRAISLVGPVFQKVWLRGDTDFSLTENFDRWSEKVSFVFGYDAQPNLVGLADELPNAAWKRLNRPPRYEVKTEERKRPDNVKEQIVREREYKNIRLRMPSDGLISNWAYMVIAALAWNLKAWYGLVTQSPSARRDIMRMEFKRFLISYIQLPCQIVNTGRRLVYRILTYSKHLETFFATFDYIKQLRFA